MSFAAPTSAAEAGRVVNAAVPASVATSGTPRRPSSSTIVLITLCLSAALLAPAGWVAAGAVAVVLMLVAAFVSNGESRFVASADVPDPLPASAARAVRRLR